MVQMTERDVDVVVVGGGPAGATAATDLARAGRSVLLLDRAGRVKPCGGAIPPKAIEDFGIPEGMIVARARSATIVSPKGRRVDMPITEGGFVGMVDRGPFDEFLRGRAASAGAERRTGLYAGIERGTDGGAIVHYRPRGSARDSATVAIRARMVVGADGARSEIGNAEVPGAKENLRSVFAYHEIVRAPADGAGFDQTRCDVIYDQRVSPDFYGWIFPHGETVSIGTGSAVKGFGLRESVEAMRIASGLDQVETIRREGAPLPLQPLPRWDNGRDVILAGDAAGVVAPASGEGIYYAMLGGRLAAQAIDEALATGDARALAQARKRFMRTHGAVFWILGLMQTYWYGNDGRRERFVSICQDRDVQALTWDAYMNKELVKARPLAHLRIFFKNLAHLSGLARA